jgi:hypothetical protein
MKNKIESENYLKNKSEFVLVFPCFEHSIISQATISSNSSPLLIYQLMLLGGVNLYFVTQPLFHLLFAVIICFTRKRSHRPVRQMSMK